MKFRKTFQHIESWPTNISYLDFGLKPAVFGCLTNAIAPPPIALESCSTAQTDWPVLKIFWLGVADFCECCQK